MTQATQSTSVPERYAGFVTLLTLGIAAGAVAAAVLHKTPPTKSEATTTPPPGAAHEWLGIGGACRPPGAGT